MERILKGLSDKGGNAFPLACAIVLVVILISSAIMEYIRLNVIATGVRNALQASVISVATENYDEVYNGLREGYSGGYKKSGGGSWDTWMDKGNVYSELDDLLGLNNMHIKISGGKDEYRLSDLTVNLINSPLAPVDPEAAGKFEADASISIEVPLSFGWDMLPPVKMAIKTSSRYTPKF